MAVTYGKFAGRNLLIKAGATATMPGTPFTTVGGATLGDMTGTQEIIDTTDKDDDPWKKGIQGGIRDMKLSLQGRITAGSAPQLQLLLNNWLSGLLWTYQFAFGNGSTFTGVFIITSLKIEGDVKDAQKFTASFESQDTVTAVVN